MKPFVYLIQAESRMPYPDLPDANNDIILLTWGTQSDDGDAVFYPGSSWNEGRNRLLAEARRRVRECGENYLYFIFIEEPGLYNRFGEDYLRYKENVPRWIPKFRPYMQE